MCRVGGSKERGPDGETGRDALDAVLRQGLALLQAGAGDPDAAFRTLALATVQDGAPGIRTVVLRRFAAAERVAEFHTDARSPKLAALLHNPRAALHGWDKTTRIQLRLDGTVTVAGPAETEAAWAALPGPSRASYAVGMAPGTPIAAPEDARATHPPAQAQAVFRLLRLRFDALEYLSLAHGAHRRARFDWRHGGAASTWLVP
jgi:pyridoxamine 5'-phosphate oxidase